MNTENNKSWSVFSVIAITWAASTLLDHIIFFFATGPFNFSIIEYLSPTVWVALTLVGIISIIQVKRRNKKGLSLSIIATAVGVLFIAQLVYFLFLVPTPHLF